MMLVSLIFIYLKKYESKFKFLSKDFWYIFIIGLVLLMSNFYSETNKTILFRCHANAHIFSFAFYLVFVPILHKLVICFPEENKYSEWLDKHKYIFLFLLIALDEFITSLLLITPFSIEKVQFEDGVTIEICKMNNSY
eukprot:jgi/Orpsp1_1/1183905/evm.model.c7180000087172.1